MSSPWKVNPAPVVDSMANIMSEEYAHRLHAQEVQRCEKQRNQALAKAEVSECPVSYSAVAETAAASAIANTHHIIPPEVLAFLDEEERAAAAAAKAADDSAGCDSDDVIARMLQSQFDHEYNEELRRIEQKRNKQSKVTVTLDHFRRNGDLEFMDEAPLEEEEDEETRQQRDWDHFEANQRLIGAIPKCGFMVDNEGEMITKHDSTLCDVQNACRMMSSPPEFPAGDGAAFDMKLSNKVYNQLKTYWHKSSSLSGSTKKNTMQDRKANALTAEMGMDSSSRLLLYKLINNQILEQINGIVSTGKEAVILHANSDAAYTGEADNAIKALMPAHLLPKECAIKIFKTTLNEFKQRDRYIRDDFRFKDRFGSQNKRAVINMWAEKEMHNLMRMQDVGIPCPSVVVLKRHILVMSFIGDNHNAAPKLKNARLSQAELSCAYEEIVTAMRRMYNEAKLVHADLSEYNILWYDGKCWFIDVAQAVEPEHPSALEFLMRDCANIVNFFEKRGLPNIYTKEQLFEHVSALNAETHNAGMLERIHTRGVSIHQATAPEQEDQPDECKPIDFPFELAWEKSQTERLEREAAVAAAMTQPAGDESIDCAAAHALEVLSLRGGSETSKATTTRN